MRDHERTEAGERELTPCGNIVCTGCRVCGCPALGIAPEAEVGEREALIATIMRHPWLETSYAGHTQGECPSCPGRVIAGGFNSPSHAEHLADTILAARRAPIEDAEPVAYAVYWKDNGDWAGAFPTLDWEEHSLYRRVPLYRHPAAPQDSNTPL